jgi:hypothetical protein
MLGKDLSNTLINVPFSGTDAFPVGHIQSTEEETAGDEG